MKRWFLALWLPFLALPAWAGTNATVCIVTIREDITHNTPFLIRRAINEAAEKQAARLVIEMDTNGGRIDAAEDIVNLLLRAPFKTCTFVNTKAFSAGAYIAVATDRIYMTPGSVIGDAKPILVEPSGGIAETSKGTEEKMNSGMRALMRTAAQQKGHNPDVFEAMVDMDKELVLDGKTIKPKGKLLTLTDQEALQSYGTPPKPLLSAGTVKSEEELLQQLGLTGAPVVRISPTGFEVLGRWLTALGPLLIMVGFIAVYVELKAPGLGVATVVAVAAFGLFFLGTFIAGLAGWEDVLLFAIGLALLAVEIFILPGFGVVGVLGIICILASLVLGMTQRLPGGPILPAWGDLQFPLLKVLLSFTGSVVAMALLARWLPETRLFRRIELSATSPTPPAAGLPVGAAGVAETALRPAGKGRFDGQLVDVETEGDLIEKGAAIRIVTVAGSRVVVARA